MDSFMIAHIYKSCQRPAASNKWRESRSPKEYVCACLINSIILSYTDNEWEQAAIDR